MQNLILQPVGIGEAKQHFNDTIVKKVNIDKITRFLSKEDIKELKKVAINNELEIWGVTPGQKEINLSKWQRTNVGDLVLFSKENKIFYIAQLAHKLHNKNLSEYLWGKDKNGQTWEYIYFLINGTEEDIAVKDLNNLLGYLPNNVVRGFNVIDENKARDVLERYGHFENALAEVGSRFSEPTDKEITEIEKKSEKIKSIAEVKSLLREYDDKLRNKSAQEKIRLVKSIIRNRKISELIKQANNYTCQICGYKGFEKRNGGIYAEVHHKEELAATKRDMPENMVCVCANCHRKIHYGK